MASLSTNNRSRRGTQPEFPLNQDINKITKKKPSSGETKNNDDAPPPVDVFDIDKIYQFKLVIPATHSGSGCDPQLSLFRNYETIDFFGDKDGYGSLPSFREFGYVPVVTYEMAMHFIQKLLLLKEEGEDAEATAIKIKGVVKEYHEWVATQKEGLTYQYDDPNELVDCVTTTTVTGTTEQVRVSHSRFGQVLTSVPVVDVQVDVCGILAIILKVGENGQYNDSADTLMCLLLNSVKEEENCAKLMKIVSSCDIDMWHVKHCDEVKCYSIEWLTKDIEETAGEFDLHELHQCGVCDELIQDVWSNNNACCDRCEKLCCEGCYEKCGFDCDVKYCQRCETRKYVGGDTHEFLSCRH